MIWKKSTAQLRGRVLTCNRKFLGFQPLPNQHMINIAWVIQFCAVSYWEMKVDTPTSAINLPGLMQFSP